MYEIIFSLFGDPQSMRASNTSQTPSLFCFVSYGFAWQDAAINLWPQCSISFASLLGSFLVKDLAFGLTHLN